MTGAPLFWAFALVLLPLALMYLGDLDKQGFKSPAFDALKTASLVVSLPLLLVFIIMALSLLKALRENKNQQD